MPPYLLIHGELDKSVPLQQSLDFQAKLKANDVACELIVIPGTPHGLSKWESFAPGYTDRMVAWLREKLN